MAAVAIMKNQGVPPEILAGVAEFGGRAVKRDPKKYGIPSHEDIASDFRGLYKLSPLGMYGRCDYDKANYIQGDLEDWYKAEGKEAEFVSNIEARYLHHYRDNCRHRYVDANPNNEHASERDGPNGEVLWMAYLTPYEREMMRICARIHLLADNYA